MPNAVTAVSIASPLIAGLIFETVSLGLLAWQTSDSGDRLESHHGRKLVTVISKSEVVGKQYPNGTAKGANSIIVYSLHCLATVGCIL